MKEASPSLNHVEKTLLFLAPVDVSLALTVACFGHPFAIAFTDFLCMHAVPSAVAYLYPVYWCVPVNTHVNAARNAHPLLTGPVIQSSQTQLGLAPAYQCSNSRHEPQSFVRSTRNVPTPVNQLGIFQLCTLHCEL